HRREDPSFEKVCHALFLFFSNLLDRPEEAAHWETRAIELAYPRGQAQRSLGRLVNLAMLQARLGWLERAQSLIRFVRQDASCLRNVELDAFSRLVQCVVLGRQGIHRQAVQQLHKLSAFNQRSNRSRNIEAGIHIELAENLNRLLQPESALQEIEGCRRLVNAEYKLDDAVDAALAEAQSWMLLGQLDRTRQILAGLDGDQAPVRLVRRRLLLTRLLLQQGDFDQAEEEAAKTAGMLGGQRQQEKISCQLILAETCLQARRLPDAQQALTVAFQMTQAGRLPALQAEAYRLQACLEMARKRPDRAKACCLRGLQIVARLEDPFRSARLQRRLGQAWLSLGENRRALSEMTRALQFYKQRLFHVQASNRRAFSKRWIDPIEQDRARALPSGTPVVPRYLTELRQFNAWLATGPDSARLGEKLLEAAGECISSSGNVFLRSIGIESFQLVASRGRCLRSGRQLLAWSESPDAVLAGKVFSRGNGSFTEIGIRLTQAGRMQGLIYLERPGSAPSEEELDFLACLAASAELSLRPQAPSSNFPRAKASLHPSGVPFVAEHPSMIRLLEEVSRIAPTTATVLISGESGTGKELVARAIHALSTRRQGPFVAVNCSGLTGSLIESELFGHSKGSFTGAGRDRRGLFEAAHRGTLFLDEIATMSPELQRSLLRALENRAVRRLGETHERKVDLRILSATNQPLGQLVEEGAFRRDLYHRLRVCELHIPPLRRRRTDIVHLCRHFLAELNQEGGRRVQLSKEALSLLQRMDLPGNVRELHNLLESAYYLCSGNRIGVGDLAARIDPSQDGEGSPGPCRKIVEGIIRGQLGFWEDVRDPFLSRDLSRRDVQEIISMGLARCGGNYRRLIELFRLPRDDYKRLMGFLSHHGCKVDFRKFRNN
ncbi:MAG: sigma-54 dependent transcriptional regulator, partial [Acidobacteriota bacterium]